MSDLIKQLNKTLSPACVKLVKQVGHDLKKPMIQDRLLLIGDTLRAISGRRNTDLRYLLCRNAWATTEELAADFDEMGGSEMFRACLRPMFRDVPINHPQLVRLESDILSEFLGKSAAAKLGLGSKNLRKLADEAAADNGLNIISKTWTLHYAMKTCRCKPAGTRALESELALFSLLKAAAVMALIAADLLALSTPATIPLGVLSIATAGILLKRGC